MEEIIRAARATRRPLALVLFAGGGGATKGYIDAGFACIGVDSDPKMLRGHLKDPHSWVIQGDAFEVLARYWAVADFIHASPPCQWYTSLNNIHRRQYDGGEHLAHIQEVLPQLGRPYCIENVPGAADILNPHFLLCGSMFPELGVYRHRIFQTNFPVPVPKHPDHSERTAKAGRRPKEGERISPVGHFPDVELARRAMGMEWGTQRTLAQAVPPAYTRYIGKYALLAAS